MSKTIKGTKNNDLLIGDDSDNKIHGKKGDDEILGLGGNDELKGDQGNDLLDGGEGNDILEGKKGNDSLFGDAGDDLLVGDGSAKDFLSGGSGGSGKGSGGSGKGSGDASGKASGKGSGKGSGSGSGKKSKKGSGKGSEKASGKGSDAGSGNGSGSGKASGSGKGSGSGSGKASGSGSGDGNDYLDGGAGNDRLFARGGDDTGNYNVSENSGATDTYDGGRGIDTLSLELTLQEWLDPGFQTDLANYLTFLDTHIDGNTGEADDASFGFTAFDLAASAWENLVTSVDGIETNPEDEAVTAIDDNLATDEESAIQGNVLDDNGNGADDIPDYLREVTLVSSTAGNLQLNDDGSFDYDPDGQFEELAAGELGQDSFVYQVEDADGDTDMATATVIITGVNDAPTLADSSLGANEDGAEVSVDLSALGDDIDSDDDGSSLSYVLLNTAPAGAASIDGTALKFDTGSDFQNLAQGQTHDFDLNVEAIDAHGASATNTVAVTVTGVNDAPTLADDSLAASEDGTQVSVDLTALGDDIDSDDDGSTLNYSLLNAAAGGSAVINNGSLDYDPGNDFQSLAQGETTGFDLNVEASDAYGATASNKIAVTITGVNDAPTLADGSIDAAEDGAQVSIDLSALGDDIDSNDDGSSLSYSLLNAAPGGSASIDGTALDYDPGSDFQSLALGETQNFDLNVQASDTHGATASNTVAVTVTGANDAPTLGGGNLSATEDGAQVSIDLSALGADIDSDDDGSSLSYSLLNSAPAGSASIDGTALDFDTGSGFQSLAAGETTSFDLQIQAADTHAATATNAITVTVTGVNDDPTIDGGDTSGDVTLVPGQTPFTVEQWTGYTGAFDRASLVAEAANRAADYSATTNIIDYTDDPGGFAGELPGSSPWPAAAANGVSGTNHPLNNTFFARITANILITASDTYTFRTFNDDGVYLTVNNQQIITDPNQHGEQAFTGSIALDPGIYPLELYFFENGGEASLELSFSDSAGVFQHVDTSDATASGSLQFSDVDLSDSHTVSVAAAGAVLGSLTATVDADTTGSGTGGVVNWEFQIDNGAYQELGAGESTTESFVVTVDDGKGGTAQETVTVTINGGNDAPAANADSAETDEDTAVTINVLGNDTDPDSNDTLTLVSAANGDNGTVGIVNNQLVYTPNANFNGSDSFSYTMEDSGGISSTATVSVTVNPVADPAQLGSAEVDLTETDAQQSVGGVLSISDPDAGEESFNPQTGSLGDYGSFNIDASGTWSYTTDGALDFLAEGQEVSDSFTVSSIDGSVTSVTVNITGTADGPTAVADTGSVSASGPAQDTGNTVYWVDWTNITPTNSGVTDEVTIDGTITLPDRTIGVTYTGQIYPVQTFVSPSNTIQYWDSFNGSQWLANGDGVYTSDEVANGPGATNLDFIALGLVDTPRNLSFSEPVANLFFAVASMNNNGYLFDQPFTVVSSADGPNDRGEWGHTAGITLSENNGQYGISTAGFSPNEFHGVLAINNAVDSLTWVSQTKEFWQGFTVGTYGVATSATISGNVINNDDQGGNPPVEVSDVNGSAMVGNSVTLNLLSGAILKVDRDGDYLYDDNNAFASLAAGQTSVDTVTYTIEDTSGNSDSATLSVTVVGVNDAPVAFNDAMSTNEDLPGSISIPLLLSNDTDVDAGDTKAFVSAQDAVNGTVSVSGSNVQFLPDPDFNGEGSFTYTMRDAAGLTSTATVIVTVNPVPDIHTPQNLVTNGSFESGTTGWTTLAGGVDVVSGWEAADGSTSLDMNAFERGGVEQTISTVAGTTYQVGFALSKNPGETGTAIARVEAAGSSQDYAFSAANSITNMLWTTESFSFTAAGSSTLLSFTSLTPSTAQGFPGDAQGPALDEVVVVTNEIVNGFDIGLGGDKVDLSGLLTSINAPHNVIAFAQGFVNFQPSGADTLIQIDADGSAGGQDYLTVMTLVGVNLTVGDTDNYIL